MPPRSYKLQYAIRYRWPKIDHRALKKELDELREAQKTQLACYYGGDNDSGNFYVYHSNLLRLPVSNKELEDWHNQCTEYSRKELWAWVKEKYGPGEEKIYHFTG